MVRQESAVEEGKRLRLADALSRLQHDCNKLRKALQDTEVRSALSQGATGTACAVGMVQPVATDCMPCIMHSTGKPSEDLRGPSDALQLSS